MNVVRILLWPSNIMLVIHWTMALLLMQSMFNIREDTIQAIIGRGPVPYLSRKVTMPAKKLLLGLMESLA